MIKKIKKLYDYVLQIIFAGLVCLNNPRGTLSLRDMFQSKEKIRQKMSALWDNHEKNNHKWKTKEEKNQYEEYSEKVKALNRDIKLKNEFIEDFKSSQSKEDLKFEVSQRDASLFKIIKQAIFEQRKDSFGKKFKDDYGRCNEVLQEHRSKINLKHIRDDCLAVPLSAFCSPVPQKKRTDITSTTQGGDSLISEIVVPSLYAEGLYEKTWLAEANVPMINNLEGDVKVPKLSTSPDFSWVSETGSFTEQDTSFDDVVLQPKYAGAIQVFSLGLFLRSAGESIVRFVQQELVNKLRAGVEKSFIQDDGTANKPKGIKNLIPAGNIVNAGKDGQAANAGDVDANTGGELRFDEIQSVVAKILNTNQSKPLLWLLNTMTQLKAEQVLKFPVNGASELFKDNMLGGRKAFVTNGVPSDVTKGTGKTSEAYLIQPESLVVGRWTGGLQLDINTQDRDFWDSKKIGVRVLDVCNIISRRDSDLAAYKQLAN